MPHWYLRVCRHSKGQDRNEEVSHFGAVGQLLSDEQADWEEVQILSRQPLISCLILVAAKLTSNITALNQIAKKWGPFPYAQPAGKCTYTGPGKMSL